MSKTVVIFPDTNIFLHYPPIKDIDWKAIAGADQVKLMVCLPVIDELDAKKSGHSLQDRAKRAVREIRNAKRESEIREGVSLEIFSYSIRSHDFPATLSIESGDDKIVHCVLKYKEANPESDVRVVTEDMGMEVRCEAHGILCLTPEPTKRLPDPVDEHSKVIRKLRTDLARLENRVPNFDLQFRIENGPGFSSSPCKITLKRDSYIPNPQYSTTDQIEQKVAFAVSNHSNEARKKRGTIHFPDEELKEYNEQRAKYITRYGHYLQSIRNWQVTREIDLVMHLQFTNTGSCVANNIIIQMNLPGVFAVAEDANEKGKNETLNALHVIKFPMGFPRSPYPPRGPRLFDPATDQWGDPTFTLPRDPVPQGYRSRGWDEPPYEFDFIRAQGERG